MGTLIDITGKRFGELVVVKYVGRNKGRHSLWLCQCDCGNTKIISKCSLVSGTTVSCGCYRRETEHKYLWMPKIRMSRIYNTWAHMKERCLNPKISCWELYGGRGIKICDEWLDFENFKNDMYESYITHVETFGEKNTTIDRIDVNGNYEPSNCRWATQKEQTNNMRRTIYIYIDGEKISLSEAADKYNIGIEALRYRVSHNWSGEKLIKPTNKRKSHRRIEQAE